MQKEYNYIAKYLDELQAGGIYTFTFSDIRRRFSEIQERSLQVSLSRMTGKGRIVVVRSGFYIIIPPEYSHPGILPPALYVDDLMKYLGKEYYVGLLSAAALLGSAHQQPQQGVGHVAQHRLAMRGGAVVLAKSVAMTHFSFPLQAIG